MERITTTELQRIPPLSDFPMKILNLMVRLGQYSLFRGGRIISYQKDPCQKALLILSGQVEKVIYLADERTLKIGMATRGDWVSLPEMVMESAHLHNSQTRGETALLSFGPTEYYELMKEEFFNSHMVRILSKEIILLHRSMEYNTPRARIIQLIRERVVVGLDGAACLTMTQDSMAEETGTARETVNRCLKDLERSGIVRTGRGSIEVLDLAELDITD